MKDTSFLLKNQCLNSKNIFFNLLLTFWVRDWLNKKYLTIECLFNYNMGIHIVERMFNRFLFEVNDAGGLYYEKDI